jgi:peptide deformylase
MALLPIVTGEQNPMLRRTARKVPAVTKDIKKLIKDMEETTLSQDGLGLAAPQVGLDLRLCLVRINDKLVPLINPAIMTKSHETDIAEEGCLSLPDLSLPVLRSSWIVVRYQDLAGKEQERRLEALEARIVQHEVDHLEGILITDYVTVPAPMQQNKLQ